MCYYGRGLPEDHTEAYLWFHKAADQGDESAQRFLRQWPAGWKNVWFASIVAQCIVAIVFLFDCLRPGGKFSGLSQRVVVSAGVFGLLSGILGFFLFTHRELHEHFPIFAALTVTRWLLGAFWVIGLIQILRPAKADLPDAPATSDLNE